MRSFKILILVTSAILFTSFGCKNNNRSSQNKDTVAVQSVFDTSKNLKVMIYYFHSTHRCPTCIGIEANVRNVLDDNFQVEKQNGLIDLKTINFDDKENYNLVQKYGVSTSALHILSNENGKEVDHDLTNFAFTYSSTQPEMFKSKISDTLKYLLKL